MKSGPEVVSIAPCAAFPDQTARFKTKLKAQPEKPVGLPHHSWERGTNERTTGLIRQHLPENV